MKLYEYGPTWYAAKNLRDAVREIHSENGDSIREILREIEGPLTAQQLEDYVFQEDVYADDGPTLSFKEKLDQMIAAGEKFPTAFASSEY